MTLQQLLRQIQLPQKRPSAISIGTFDGVHLGHQKIIQGTLKVAQANNLRSVLGVFEKTPREVLQPDRHVTYLRPFQERLEIIRSLGVDSVIPLTFSLDLSRVVTLDFLKLLQQHTALSQFVIGDRAIIGNDRLDATGVTSQANSLGIGVTVINEIALEDGRRVCSSNIRTALANGDLDTVQGMLGVPYRVSGAVVSGDQYGRELGFPTANISYDPQMTLPKDGVYVTRVEFQQRHYIGATSIGVRPTVTRSGERTVETYILDFDEQIYGEQISLTFLKRLRDEYKFDSVLTLKKAIKEDVKQARSTARELSLT